MSRYTRARPGTIELGTYSRLRHWWPPPRPRAIVRRLLSAVVAVIVSAAILFAGIMLFATLVS